MRKISYKNRGFSLLEVVFYIAVFAILSIVVINALLTMTRAFRESTIESDIVRAGSIMERISREVKQAISISSISSTSLSLSTTDEAGTAKTVQFSLSGSDLVLTEDGVTTGNMNSSNLYITNIAFTQITNTTGFAIKTTLTVQSARDTAGRTFSYYDTAVLRGSY